MKYKFRFTHRVADKIAGVVNDLRREGAPVRFQGVEWDSKTLTYTPGGMWYYMPPTGGPLLHSLSPPHHPMEVIAARAGFGEDSKMDTLARVKLLRSDQPWWTWVGNVAPTLGLTRAQVAILFHLFTPLHTNGGGPTGLDHATLMGIRDRFYRSAGLHDSWELAKHAEAGREGVRVWNGGNTNTPCRMQFWGTEVSGEVEL